MDNGSTYNGRAIYLAAIGLIILLPLGGVLLAGKEIAKYLQFPPLTRYVEHAGFSWLAFGAIALFVFAAVSPLIGRAVRGQTIVGQRPARSFPLWGWGSIFLCAVAWVLAWSRFDWFVDYQIFTFSPLWFGYIGVVNALTYMRSGRCMVLHRPKYLISLFMVSAIFWWYFEYLNRFVQNWYYINIEGLSSAQYVLFATLPFSTVLPAVLGTYELLRTFPRLSGGLATYKKLDFVNSRPMALTLLVVASIGLLCIGIYPDYLFPLLWLSPLLILTSVQLITGNQTIFAPLSQGNWSRIFLLALSALICGLFWEMWNYFSYAKWLYSIPFVQRFHIFEMPVLGYAGYLPFGLECAVVAECFAKSDQTD
ncbi:MAG: hypothetical protein HKN69_00775 [Desulfofustis sp.]|nr:hypothetical protein [Desulfofustis sp.]